MTRTDGALLIRIGGILMGIGGLMIFVGSLLGPDLGNGAPSVAAAMIGLLVLVFGLALLIVGSRRIGLR